MSNVLKALARGGAVETDPNFKQTVLLLHGDGTNGAQNNTFLDSSTNNFTITRNGNTTQGTFSPFSLSDGYWSNYLDGTDDYLSVADNAVLRPGAGAFTLEAWIYRNASGAAHTVYAKGGASTGIVFQVTSGNVLRFTHTTTNIDSTGTVAANAWVHVAVVREGTGTNQTKLYINGVQDGQGTVSTDFTQTEEVRIGTNRGATEDFAGYISNMRFVKGSALYTAGFTPSTVPLTTTSQGASSSEVELLTCQSNRFVDNSTNAFAITRNGDVRVTPFSPFAPSAAYSAGTNGGSGYFDGTGDYLSAPDSDAWDFGSGNFTIECWAYTETFASQYNVLVCQWNTSNAWIFNITSSLIRLYANIGGTQNYNVSVTNTTGQWDHFAVTRSGTTLTFYKNGSSVGTVSISGIINNSTNQLTVGILGDQNSTTIHKGYISGLRIIKGTAKTSFDITAPPAVESGTSLLLNFTNAGIFDQTGKNNLETVGNAQIDTTTKKYGTGSMKFDGTGDWLLVPNNDQLIFRAGDFTVEGWFYGTSNAASMPLFSIGRFDAGILLRINSHASNDSFYINSTSYNWNPVSNFPLNQWNHVAVTRAGSTVRIFVNGTQVFTTTNSADINQTTATLIGAQTHSPATVPFIGYIDDFRITKGVARYTANFTAPTKEFPDL